MELEDLLLAWKGQDKYINQHLKSVTFNYLLKQKSKGILSQIRKRLSIELMLISFLFIGFNFLFFIVEVPYSTLRWACFVIFNFVAVGVIFTYFTVITQINSHFEQHTSTILEQIIQNLNRFRMHSRYLNIPIGIICIIMFAGSQDLVYWLPWLLVEFFLWRWMLTPKISSRFERYILDLEYSLDYLKEIKE